MCSYRLFGSCSQWQWDYYSKHWSFTNVRDSPSKCLSHTHIHTHTLAKIWHRWNLVFSSTITEYIFILYGVPTADDWSGSWRVVQFDRGKNWRFPPQPCAFKTFFNALSHPNSLELKRKFLLDIIKCLITVKHTFGTLTWYEGSNNNLAKTLNDFKNTIHLLVECEKQIIFLQCDTSWKPLCLLKTQYYVPAFYTGGF